MEGAGTCKRLCFHCCCCSTGWLQWDESTAMDWKGNNPGPKRQVGKEGPRHGAAWDRDSEQEPGWLWPPCISGHKEWSCQWEKHFHDLLSCKLSAPGRQGANAAKPKPSPNHALAWVLGESMGTGRATWLPWHPGAQPAEPPLCRGLAGTCREVALPHLDVPP